jgi:hypothetical protein
MNVIKNLFVKLPALELAKLELAEAERERLSAQSYHDYYTNISQYHNARIKRLENYIGSSK